MGPAAEDVRTFLAARIPEQLRRVEQKAVRLRRVHLRVQSANLVLTALATLLAGLTAAAGPLAGQGPPAWRWSCAMIAVVTATAGVLAGFHQRLQLPDQLARRSRAPGGSAACTWRSSSGVSGRKRSGTSTSNCWRRTRRT